ncbi:hypothetical protein BMW23_0490 [Bodo saltans virus]|jgi:hypothetical protein|uniref:Uncharacterized protein n=1 Tax=Bodo saltans virus TaxID=2024608 RepID=A0A2H4UUD7_9VIRU|nr:hypothetical protein QJ851_gp0477 [Bodo saltans virus]ATZ80540.1 hypothetical protein BMW23_0490 [Bodo saltans virus]
MPVSGFSSAGGFNRSKYDMCEYQQNLHQSVSPLAYQMYGGAYENCQKCVYDDKSFYRPFDLVDMESELKNITRRSSRCPQNKYLPNCKKSGTCTSTFDKTNPIAFPQEVCPIVLSNMPRMTSVGYELNVEPFCAKK